MLLSLFFILWLSACSIVDIRNETRYTYQDGRIAQPMLGQIVPGRTTRQWLLENFGEPSKEDQDVGGGELLFYKFDEHIKLRTRILFLFNYQTSKVVQRNLEVAVKDDVVYRVGPVNAEEKSKTPDMTNAPLGSETFVSSDVSVNAASSMDSTISENSDSMDTSQ